MGIGAGTAMLISAAVGAAVGGTQMAMQKREGDKAGRRMQTEKAAAESAMASQKREEALANQQEDVDLAALAEADAAEPTATMNRTRLSGAGGVDPEQLRLGTQALFGGLA